MKKIFSYLFIFAITLSVCLNVNAFDRDYNVQDFSDTLSEKQLEKLRDRAEEFYDEYGLEMMIYIFKEGYEYDQLKYKCNSYWDNKYPNSYGACFAIDVTDAEENSYVVDVAMSRKYYTDSEREKVFDNIRNTKSDGTYAMCEQFIDSAEEYSDEEKNKTPFFMLIILPFVISGITIAVLISKNKMVRKATTAAAYLNKDAINFTRKEDRFVTTHVTRVPINTGSGGSHGGGSHGAGHSGGRI
ncbi:MAG: TPM domain-containing protein [Bacilli bacterium]|nr:TPM domain-containing protein [Bacilli bacterium]